MSEPERTPVGPGTSVTLKFTLKLPNGEVIDSTGDASATFVVGDGNLLPGFERAMFGLRKGDVASLDIPAAQGFGEGSEENLKLMPCRDFAQDMTLEPGLVVVFRDADGGDMPGVVRRLHGELVEIDFNHPLAGRDLVFDVEVMDVVQVSNEITRS